MRSRTEWVIEMDLIGQLLPHPKEGWIRVVLNPDVARDLHSDLGVLLRSGKRRVIDDDE
jgi:hypothetical protein